MKWQYFKRRATQVLWNEDNALRFKNIRYLPRWIVVLIDLCIVCASFLLSYLIVREITPDFYQLLTIPEQALAIIAVHFLAFFVFSTYSGLIRHSTFVDILKLALACLASATALAVINYSYYYLYAEKVFLMPFLIVNMAITFVLMLQFRVVVKSVYAFFTKMGASCKSVLVVGINDESIAVAEAITISKNQNFQLKGFVSLSKKHDRIKILGQPIFKFDEDFFTEIEYLKVDGLIFVGNQVSVTKKNSIVDKALAYDLEIFNAPDIIHLDEGVDVVKNIKQIQIEDLLERAAIHLDDTQINRYLNNKTILITGGAGSIGSEIVRQVAAFNPKKVIVLDQAESPLYALELELRQSYPQVDFEFVMGDVRRKQRMENVFEAFDIKVVFHAAAYKHVPLMENNPREAIWVNVLGTVNLADLAVQHQVERFVMVSTDKAVNPTNVMGASKRAAEIYVQALQEENNHSTKFITTRFGNVLGSNGSVIPHFKKQIEQGGPVTVTHKDIIRYFMTIPEACQLVLQAGTMGKGGEIFVFDMGKPVRIMDLAEKMIKLSGFEPYHEIDIEVIGLRPGEKLYEELLSDESTTLPTHHRKIMVAKVCNESLETVTNQIIELAAAAESGSNDQVVLNLKRMVPEFVSKNSIYEMLDQEVRSSK
ncbi:polysaccharide biosynthesis protein [Nonlabens xiamenensis]|uniref:polysaccharide biosynthesis protein n=1 Tax=Nonlabens xiamenensis TaxID=2341043 RepID=UPI000F60610F|nr:nucleoside-diphosphate sugar epimerase/dehydratase [Nonlabens xiamenensis]